jgi:hypothetical protein
LILPIPNNQKKSALLASVTQLFRYSSHTTPLRDQNLIKTGIILYT